MGGRPRERSAAEERRKSVSISKRNYDTYLEIESLSKQLDMTFSDTVFYFLKLALQNYKYNHTQ